MRVLLISPHADDVEIGMCGTICKLRAEGNDVKLITAIIPCENIDGKTDLIFKDKRMKEQEEVADRLGIEMDVLDLSPYEFCFDRKHIKIFDKIVRDYKPNQIFSCWTHDTHQDHIAMSSIIDVAARKNNSSLYLYENMIPGGIGKYSFNPQYFVNISEFIELKKDILNIYQTVFSENNNYVRAILARSEFRGGQIGVEHAEAFEVIKKIAY